MSGAAADFRLSVNSLKTQEFFFVVVFVFTNVLVSQFSLLEFCVTEKNNNKSLILTKKCSTKTLTRFLDFLGDLDTSDNEYSCDTNDGRSCWRESNPDDDVRPTFSRRAPDAPASVWAAARTPNLELQSSAARLEIGRCLEDLLPKIWEWIFQLSQADLRAGHFYFCTFVQDVGPFLVDSAGNQVPSWTVTVRKILLKFPFLFVRLTAKGSGEECWKTDHFLGDI